MCGEKECSNPEVFDIAGSPPRVRGKDHAQLVARLDDGITPACAGKSASGQKFPVVIRDHPRMRGEKKKQGKYAEECMGSPPHARGKEPPFLSDFRTFGITPACAGKSRSI